MQKPAAHVYDLSALLCAQSKSSARRGKLDFAKGNQQKIAESLRMEILVLDEFSMLDEQIFEPLAVRITHPHG